ncbi:hypothetical protein NKI25_18615 [Mesorhizobium sp. M0808]|uniref:hypothetical protein n=1 Tax=Mesorhizobium sp. M0808 TaxID=2957002 RepID=UPI00333BE87F
MRKLWFIAFFALFATGFLVVISRMGVDVRHVEVEPAAPKPMTGRLTVRSLDDMSLYTTYYTKIVLCGVEPRPGVSARDAATAVQTFQGNTLTCKPVGLGTPCDGRTAPKFNGAIVVQCFLPDGTDLAAKLVEIGLLCGLPAQAGGTYKACPR